MRLVVVKGKECVLSPLDARTPNAIFDCPFSREGLIHAASSISTEEFDALLDASVDSIPGNYHLFVLPPGWTIPLLIPGGLRFRYQVSWSCCRESSSELDHSVIDGTNGSRGCCLF